MRGVILAGGTGSRLFPLTRGTNKHLLPVGRYPMVFYPLARLAQAGIGEILIVTSPDHIGAMAASLGSGSRFGVELTYRIQDQPGGIAQALSLARSFVRDDRCAVVLGDNVFQDDLKPYIEQYAHQAAGAKVFLKQVEDPERFGVPEIQSGKIVTIEEKPRDPKSRYGVTGIYLYDPQVFDLIEAIPPSARGEVEITDLNNAYAARSQLTFDVLPGWWIDAGTFESLAQANELARDETLSIFPSHSMEAR